MQDRSSSTEERTLCPGAWLQYSTTLVLHNAQHWRLKRGVTWGNNTTSIPTVQVYASRFLFDVWVLQ